MIVLIDNYDSFSYNLVQLIGGIVKEEIKVIRNDDMTVEELMKMKPSHIILSPGPGRPADAGICEEVVKKSRGEVPILGVCLGHQGICEAFGATITYAEHLMHGKQSLINLEPDIDLFKGLPEQIRVARYHSLVADPQTMPDCLQVIARDADRGEIMAVKHKKYPIYGLQFHPESVLTPQGDVMMRNFFGL
ncbi:MAG: aminodeoxychorismate/anthranilate synthase component II [Lachnospiraceae bacterium]|nr:aminodeoxychorismate/anthranilate synthase component II [Lachnospiraceae bacterium]